MDHSDCLPTHVGGCQHGHNDCPRQAQYLEDKEALRRIDQSRSPQRSNLDDPANWNLPSPDSFVRRVWGDKATTVGQDLIDKAEGHDLKSNRVAVTVFMEVEGQWIDPENVAVEIVKYLVTQNPKGMARPTYVNAPRGVDSDQVLSATVYSVQDAQEALRSFTVTPNGRPYR